MTKTTMFERSRTKVRFSNEDMDYLFQVVLGYHTHGGATFGELFRTASKVEDGNPESWISNFKEMGERIERQAQELEERGMASAAPAFLRAFTGYRAAAFLMSSPPRATGARCPKCRLRTWRIRASGGISSGGCCG